MGYIVFHLYIVNFNLALMNSVQIDDTCMVLAK